MCRGKACNISFEKMTFKSFRLKWRPKSLQLFLKTKARLVECCKEKLKRSQTFRKRKGEIERFKGMQLPRS